MVRYFKQIRAKLIVINLFENKLVQFNKMANNHHAAEWGEFKQLSDVDKACFSLSLRKLCDNLFSIKAGVDDEITLLSECKKYLEIARNDNYERVHYNVMADEILKDIIEEVAKHKIEL